MKTNRTSDPITSIEIYHPDTKGVVGHNLVVTPVDVKENTILIESTRLYQNATHSIKVDWLRAVELRNALTLLIEQAR